MRACVTSESGEAPPLYVLGELHGILVGGNGVVQKLALCVCGTEIEVVERKLGQRDVQLCFTAGAIGEESNGALHRQPSIGSTTS